MKHIIGYVIFLFTLAINAQGKVTFTYAVKDSDSLKLDMCYPLNVKSTDVLPVLLWIHGGGFEGGSRDSEPEQELCRYAANHGYIGVSISYRLLRKGTETDFGCDCDNDEKLHVFREAVTDYLDAADYLVQNAKTFQIDTSKIIAGGSSAGAETVLNAVYMREYFIDDLPKYESVKFAGVLSLAGALVNANYITRKNALPTVIFHGTDDDLVPFADAPHHWCTTSNSGYLILDGSSVIAKKLSDLETAYYFQMVKGAGHEISSVPFDELDNIFLFFDKTVFNQEIIQTKIIKQKRP